MGRGPPHRHVILTASTFPPKQSAVSQSVIPPSLFKSLKTVSTGIVCRPYPKVTLQSLDSTSMAGSEIPSTPAHSPLNTLQSGGGRAKATSHVIQPAVHSEMTAPQPGFFSMLLLITAMGHDTIVHSVHEHV